MPPRRGESLVVRLRDGCESSACSRSQRSFHRYRSCLGYCCLSHDDASRFAFEVKIRVPFLKEGAFVAQSIATYPIARAIRKLGALNALQLAEVETAVFKWLGQSV